MRAVEFGPIKADDPVCFIVAIQIYMERGRRCVYTKHVSHGILSMKPVGIVSSFVLAD